MTITPSLSRTFSFPLGGVPPISIAAWPTKNPNSFEWDCWINIAADLKDSAASIESVSVEVVYTDGGLDYDEATQAGLSIVGALFSGGTPGFIYGVEFAVTFLDGRVFSYYISLPIQNVPLINLAGVGWAAQFNDPANSGAYYYM
jgi:hypothetical protein